ncbi:bromodomain-containing protein DDB_G0270170-like isoform X2 [Aedes albopictus]|uniref:Retrotransposon gag domain-containing protein n=1 Tax=Aedes albopictus TaxID=7160 RepID=A0ABM1YHZ9_AEDAL
MSNMEAIETFISEELSNIKKSINRPRSAENTEEKISYFTGWFEEFDKIFKKNVNKMDEAQKTKYSEQYKRVKGKVEEALLILNNNKISMNTSEANAQNIIENEEAKGISNISAHTGKEDSKQTDSSGDQRKQNPQNISHQDFANLLNDKYKHVLLANSAASSSNLPLQPSSSAVVNYNFPMQLAFQCIPEFNGSPDELNPFLYQIEFFANQFPANVNHAPLLNIVLLKLKGKATAYTSRIQGQTWLEVKQNLIREFSAKLSAEEILQKIEKLEQGFQESFKSYKERGFKILEAIRSIEPPGQLQPSFAERSLKIHFLSGLRSSHLKLLAKTQRGSSFADLLLFLEEEFVECEQMEDIGKRLRNINFSGQYYSRQNPSNYQTSKPWQKTNGQMESNAFRRNFNNSQQNLRNDNRFQGNMNSKVNFNNNSYHQLRQNNNFRNFSNKVNEIRNRNNNYQQLSSANQERRYNPQNFNRSYNGRYGNQRYDQKN